MEKCYNKLWLVASTSPWYFTASSYPTSCPPLPEPISALTHDGWHKNIVHTCFSRRRLWRTWVVLPDVPGATPRYTRMFFCSASTCHHVTYDNICVAPGQKKKRKAKVKLSFETPFTLVQPLLQALAERRLLQHLPIMSAQRHSNSDLLRATDANTWG